MLTRLLNDWVLSASDTTLVVLSNSNWTILLHGKIPRNCSLNCCPGILLPTKNFQLWVFAAGPTECCVTSVVLKVVAPHWFSVTDITITVDITSTYQIISRFFVPGGFYYFEPWRCLRRLFPHRQCWLVRAVICLDRKMTVCMMSGTVCFARWRGDPTKFSVTLLRLRSLLSKFSSSNQLESLNVCNDSIETTQVLCLCSSSFRTRICPLLV